MRRIFFFFILLYSISLKSQELTTGLIAEIPLEAQSFVGVDEFNSLYYINENILYKKTSKKIFSYSNIELGALRSVNIQNPFKIILFYADFNAVIILDNNLNELTQRIDFTQETKFNNVTQVTGSSQNNIWLYADDNKLHLYDYLQYSEVLQTQATTFYDPEFHIKNLTSTYKKVWILSENSVIEFNEYGIYTQTYELDKPKHIFPFQKGFIYITGDSYFYQKPDASVKINLEYDGLIHSRYVNSSNIFIYDGKVVYQYQIKR